MAEKKMVAKRVSLCREFLTVSETTSWAFMFVSEGWRRRHENGGGRDGLRDRGLRKFWSQNADFDVYTTRNQKNTDFDL